MPERCAEGGLPSPAPAAVRLCQEALFEGVSGKIQGMTQHRVYLWATHTDWLRKTMHTRSFPAPGATHHPLQVRLSLTQGE